MEEAFLLAASPFSLPNPAPEEVWEWRLPCSEGFFPIPSLLPLSLTHSKLCDLEQITSLCLSSFICKIGIQVVLTSESREDSRR